MTRCFSLSLLSLICILSGCTGGGNKEDLPGPPDLGCLRTCTPGCAAGSTCVVPSSLQTYTAFCAKTCTSDADCGGQRCAALFDQPGTPAVCLTTDTPARCPGVAYDPSWHCDFPPASCKDAQVLRRGFSQPANQVCGSEYILCPGGCAPGAAPGSAATCK